MVCPTGIAPQALMCTFHWSLVPKDLKLRLWALAEADAIGSKLWDDLVKDAAVIAKKEDLRPSKAHVG